MFSAFVDEEENASQKNDVALPHPASDPMLLGTIPEAAVQEEEEKDDEENGEQEEEALSVSVCESESLNTEENTITVYSPTSDGTPSSLMCSSFGTISTCEFSKFSFLGNDKTRENELNIARAVTFRNARPYRITRDVVRDRFGEWIAGSWEKRNAGYAQCSDDSEYSARINMVSPDKQKKKQHITRGSEVLYKRLCNGRQYREKVHGRVLDVIEDARNVPSSFIYTVRNTRDESIAVISTAHDEVDVVKELRNQTETSQTHSKTDIFPYLGEAEETNHLVGSKAFVPFVIQVPTKYTGNLPPFLKHFTKNRFQKRWLPTQSGKRPHVSGFSSAIRTALQKWSLVRDKFTAKILRQAKEDKIICPAFRQNWLRWTLSWPKSPQHRWRVIVLLIFSVAVGDRSTRRFGREFFHRFPTIGDVLSNPVAAYTCISSSVRFGYTKACKIIQSIQILSLINHLGRNLTRGEIAMVENWVTSEWYTTTRGDRKQRQQPVIPGTAEFAQMFGSFHQYFGISWHDLLHEQLFAFHLDHMPPKFQTDLFMNLPGVAEKVMALVAYYCYDVNIGVGVDRHVRRASVLFGITMASITDEKKISDAICKVVGPSYQVTFNECFGGLAHLITTKFTARAEMISLLDKVASETDLVMQWMYWKTFYCREKARELSGKTKMTPYTAVDEDYDLGPLFHFRDGGDYRCGY